jgi:site-specific DNA-cytosine methylase
MKHLDLFSGIGGAALAVDAVWGASDHTFVEIDPFCQAILKKH